SIALMGIAPFEGPLRGVGKIRYGQKPAPCSVTMQDADTIHVVFDDPVRAVTPGQSVVIYRDGVVMLGGVIS
ncbi:MAG: tRNA 2-thiouridine(34) synthase MnmA, partial [Lachnospiraceae bacterium]|nr:tRNA 2-thiouridine(34) synthase MnmA [Lachnospiraceae bacterium]